MHFSLTGPASCAIMVMERAGRRTNGVSSSLELTLHPGPVFFLGSHGPWRAKTHHQISRTAEVSDLPRQEDETNSEVRDHLGQNSGGAPMSPDCDTAVERLDLSLGTYVALKGGIGRCR